MLLLHWLRNKLFRNEKKQKNVFLLKSTELLLQRSIAAAASVADYRSSNPIHIFSEIEIQQGTNNYHSDRFLYNHFSCSVFYKGIHQGRIVLIYMFKEDYDENKAGNITVEEVRNSLVSEIVALSQINHKNVVRLLGCCLETRWPTLVYEFCFSTTLYNRIHGKIGEDYSIQQRLTWENRLRIATEIAEAITYLHTANTRPLLHGNIKSQNVLLDQNLGAKLYNFKHSIQIPFGKTHVQAEFKGNRGYDPPDYVATGRISEKTDVYSFGIHLLELLTGYKPGADLESSTIDNRIEKIVEQIWEARGATGRPILKQQLQASTVLAVRCTSELEEERPTMLEVSKALMFRNSFPPSSTAFLQTSTNYPSRSTISRINSNIEQVMLKYYKFTKNIVSIDTAY